ncbi:MAG: ThuA domain-containing protein [Ferruginibacter sp.]
MHSNQLIRKVFFLAAVIASFAFVFKKDDPAVLIFSKTNGFRHQSIPRGIEAIKKLGMENKFSVDATEDSLAFTTENLAKYKAVIFLNPTMDVLGDEQQKALENYMQKGGGFVGVHAATDCEYNWPWYVKMVGASFLSHPEQQVAKLTVTDNKNMATRHLPATWERKDEWYNFKSMNPDVHVLLKIEESSYKGGKNGDNHPMAWYHEYDGGRAFYTALGHTDESYADPVYLQHLLGGIKYAIKK